MRVPIRPGAPPLGARILVVEHNESPRPVRRVDVINTCRFNCRSHPGTWPVASGPVGGLAEAKSSCHGGCLVGSLDHPSTESFHVFTAHWAHSLAAIRRYEEDSECLEFNPAAALGTLMDHFERMLSGT